MISEQCKDSCKKALGLAHSRLNDAIEKRANLEKEIEEINKELHLLERAISALEEQIKYDDRPVMEAK